MGIIPATGTKGGFRKKEFQFSRPHHPISSVSPSAPFVADPKLTRGLGDPVPGSPGTSTASAILTLLLLPLSHRALRNLRRGDCSCPARHYTAAASLKGAGESLPCPLQSCRDKGLCHHVLFLQLSGHVVSFNSQLLTLTSLQITVSLSISRPVISSSSR